MQVYVSNGALPPLALPRSGSKGRSDASEPLSLAYQAPLQPYAVDFASSVSRTAGVVNAWGEGRCSLRHSGESRNPGEGEWIPAFGDLCITSAPLVDHPCEGRGLEESSPLPLGFLPPQEWFVGERASFGLTPRVIQKSPFAGMVYWWASSGVGRPYEHDKPTPRVALALCAMYNGRISKPTSLQRDTQKHRPAI